MRIVGQYFKFNLPFPFFKSTAPSGLKSSLKTPVEIKQQTTNIYDNFLIELWNLILKWDLKTMSVHTEDNICTNESKFEISCALWKFENLGKNGVK